MLPSRVVLAKVGHLGSEPAVTATLLWTPVAEADELTGDLRNCFQVLEVQNLGVKRPGRLELPRPEDRTGALNLGCADARRFLEPVVSFFHNSSALRGARPGPNPHR